MNTVKDIIEALNKKLCGATLYIALSKAFDTVDHAVLKNRLISFGLLEHAVGWFSNYLNNRSQSVKYEHLYSDFVAVH